MKILTVIGARPQFIKAAAVSRVIEPMENVSEVLVHTGQHYDASMSDIFFDELGIPQPNYNLGIGGGNHGAMTGRQLEAIEEVLLDEKPDWVLVYGDTNSTLAGALAAVKMLIPVAHVEAGLRSFNRRMPEEINRIMTDSVSNFLFAPTQTAIDNLRSEGQAEERLVLVGDVMLDASLFYRNRARCPVEFEALSLDPGEFILATVHRAENTDDPVRLQSILNGLAECGRPVYLPLHPRTRSRIDTHGLFVAENLRIVDPVGYLEMIWLEANCLAVATDSGGVQKEAYFFGKPCVTLRDETEWVELVETGWNTVVGSGTKAISTAISDAAAPSGNRDLYGVGNTAQKILECLK